MILVIVMLPEPDLFSNVGHRTIGDALDKPDPLNCQVDGELSLLTMQRHHGVNGVKSVSGEVDRRARKWYLIVIVLLYMGLLTSFCLNISLLMKDYSLPLNKTAMLHKSE